ncbi:hypothetical protein ACWKWU_00805 [Chitinophaga lutea]
MHLRHLLIGCFITGSVALLSQCISRQPPADVRGEAFVPSSSCRPCHTAIYDNWLKTAHAQTSAAGGGGIRGNVSPPGNVFHYSGGIDVTVERRDDGWFQTASHGGAPTQRERFDSSRLRKASAAGAPIRRERLDVTIGSGRKAQTFLYAWDGKFFQLPLSWFVPANAWANSPGFPPDHPKFDRIIPSQCFDCHTSHPGVSETAMQGAQLSERFASEKMLFGLDCQRCHGPGAQHTAWHTAHPEAREPIHMIRIGGLPRQRQLDVCAQCHSGLSTPQRSLSRFRPGDDLSDYILPEIGGARPPSSLDVHGNQYQLLTASRCFTTSRGMTCASCHDPHALERTNTAVFARRCMECHQEPLPAHAALKTTLPALQAACIDCHMPNLPSAAITLLTNGQNAPLADSVRTHRIAVYPERTAQWLNL